MEIGRVLSVLSCLAVVIIACVSRSAAQVPWQLYHFNTPLDYREYFNGTHYIIPQKIREPQDDVASFLYYQQLAFASSASLNATDESNPHRIVNGHRINIKQVPWQVALIFEGSFICGGSILTSQWIMTAAHCIVPGGSYQIRAGSRIFKRDGEVRNVQLIVRHAGFSLTTMNHDIALMRVDRPFKFSRFCQPVRLPKANSEFRPRSYLVSGWGLLTENGTRQPADLRAVTVNHLSKSRCRRLYSHFNIVITRFMLCASAPNRDSCSGDSGGALTNDGIAYGIVSFGIGCAQRNAPGVYSNVARLVPWIKQAIARHS